MPLSKNDFIVNVFDLQQKIIRFLKTERMDAAIVRVFFTMEGSLSTLVSNLDIDPSEIDFNDRIGVESNESQRKQTESTGRGETLQQKDILHPE